MKTRRSSRHVTRTVIGVLAVVVLSMAVPTPSFAALAAGGTAPTCGTVGHGSSTDCVRHRHLVTPTHARVKPGHFFNVQIWLHPSLRGTAVAVDVQVRLRKPDRTVGPWVTTHVFRGQGARFTPTGGWRTVAVTAPTEGGVYEVRTHLTWAPTGSGPVLDAALSSSTDSAVSQSTTVLVSDCANTDGDMANIEYFNQINFEGEYIIVVTDTGTTFEISLSCPPPPNDSIPPSLAVTLAFETNSDSTPCNGPPMVIVKAAMGSNPDCAQNVCQFTVTASNSYTGVVYSTTVFPMTMATGGFTLVPDLQAATLPICPSNSNPCIMTGTCGTSTSKEGAISLCASSSNCATPPTGSGASGYSINSNVYFQTAVADKMAGGSS